MGSDIEDVVDDDDYELDLTPPEVEYIIIKKPSPQVSRQKKIFESLKPEVAFSTHEEAKNKSETKQNEIHVSFFSLLKNFRNIFMRGGYRILYTVDDTLYQQLLECSTMSGNRSTHIST